MVLRLNEYMENGPSTVDWPIIYTQPVLILSVSLKKCLNYKYILSQIMVPLITTYSKNLNIAVFS